MTTTKRALAFAVCLLIAPAAFAQSDWTQRFPYQVPSGRSFHAMAYDADRSEVVLFGGIADNSQVLGDTWAWDGFNWTQKSPPQSPGPRFGHAMAFDAARHEVVLFGGLNEGGGIAAGTWVWNGTTWLPVDSPTAPHPRDLAAMTYDAVRREIVMFGGRDLSSGNVGSLLDDTWVWDGTHWSQKIPTTSPSARIEHAIAFDAAREEIVMFGGRLSIFPSDVGDTWAWDGVNWIEKHPAISPPPTSGHALAYDSVSARVILFGGYDNGAFSRNDTWSWQGTTWTHVFPSTSPPPNTDYAMVYDEARREVVLFGGGSFPGADFDNYHDTWVFNDIPTVPRAKEDCKNGGWSHLVRADSTPFRNQGACVSYVNTMR